VFSKNAKIHNYGFKDLSPTRQPKPEEDNETAMFEKENLKFKIKRTIQKAFKD